MLHGVAIGVLRKLFSILLLLAIGLPLATPLLAAVQDDDAHLPPCCRRHGKHRCFMGTAMMGGAMARLGMAQDPEPNHPHVTTPVEKCPYCPASMDAPAQPTASLPFFASLPPVRATYDHVYVRPPAQQAALHTLDDTERGPPVFLHS
ncbi:DUF2946 family protein [Terriglobus tenax]|uniref:DUF2946 family protein n=1 Tax=Terriglobus tenax TaxID=1111115 RepID=UPI0037DA0295